MERINKKECAEVLGVTKQRISQLVKSGVLVFGEDGKIDKQEAMKKYISCVAGAKGKIANPDSETQPTDDDSLTYWKTQTEKFKSQIAEIDLKKAKGELLDAQEVKQNAQVLGKKLQDGLLSIPERISSILAVETEPLKVRTLLLTEIKETLKQIAEELQKV